MLVSQATLNALTNNFNLAFQSGYDSVVNLWWKDIAMMIPSSTSQETHAWLSKLPQMREWVGERVVNAISTHAQVVKNKAFESTLEVDRFDIEDDQYGVYAPIARSMGETAALWPNSLILSAMQTAHSTLCYDGQNFFDTDHPVDRVPGQVATGTQRNYWSSSKALTPDNYQDVRATMMGYQGENGIPLGVYPQTLVVPPQLEVQARLICEAEYTGITTQGGLTVNGSTTNVLRGTAKVVVIPQLSNEPTAWYLLDNTRSIKPFIFQQRMAPEFVNLTSASQSEHVLLKNKFLYAATARGAGFGGLWFLAAKAVG